MRILLAGGTPTIVLGPFVDSTDGVTPETGLTVNQAAVRLSKNGAAFAQKNDATSATHGENGYYLCPLNATDTNGAGVLTVAVAATGALPVRQDYMVLPAAAYNALVAGTGNGLRAEVITISGSTTAADRLEAGALVSVPGTVDTTANAVTATTLESDDITNAVADIYNGRLLVITSGTNAGAVTRITDYALVSGRGKFTFDSLGTLVPANNDTFLVI
jgi:hypothetical protein